MCDAALARLRVTNRTGQWLTIRPQASLAILTPSLVIAPGSVLVTEAASQNENTQVGTCRKAFRLLAYITSGKPEQDEDLAINIASGAIAVSIPTTPGTPPALSASPLTGHTGFIGWHVTTSPDNYVDLVVSYVPVSSNGGFIAGIVVLAIVAIAALTFAVLKGKRDAAYVDEHIHYPYGQRLHFHAA